MTEGLIAPIKLYCLFCKTHCATPINGDLIGHKSVKCPFCKRAIDTYLLLLRDK
jgi:hypothetical protein